MSKLIYGVGVNDADYTTQPTVNGKQVICPFYRKWYDMLMRCYNAKYQAKQPTYIGCSVASEWLTFSNFKAWMERQNWQGKELDKDLLVKGNKIYSPDTCVFVDGATNLFATNNRASRSDCLLGVCFHKHVLKFMARCRNPFTKKDEHLGYFDCQQEAHQAWKKRKHELACQLAESQPDKRVADALRVRYL